MARKPEPKPAFFDHYAPFTEALENYTLKAGMLLIAAESLLQIAKDLNLFAETPALTDRLQKAITEFKQSAHSE